MTKIERLLLENQKTIMEALINVPSSVPTNTKPGLKEQVSKTRFYIDSAEEKDLLIKTQTRRWPL